MFSVLSYFSRNFQMIDCYNQLKVVMLQIILGCNIRSNDCYDQVCRSSCYDDAGRNSCYDKAGLNSCYYKAGRNSYYDKAGCIGILLRILPPRHTCLTGSWYFLFLAAPMASNFVCSSRSLHSCFSFSPSIISHQRLSLRVLSRLGIGSALRVLF